MVFEVLVVYSVHIHTMTSASQDRKLSIAIITHFLNQKAIWDHEILRSVLGFEVLGIRRNITKTQAHGLLWVVGRNHLVGFQVWDAWLSESKLVLPQIWWYDAVSKRRYSMGNSRPRPNNVILEIGPQQIKWTHNVAMSTAREKYEDTLSSRYARVAYSADNHDIYMWLDSEVLHKPSQH